MTTYIEPGDLPELFSYVQEQYSRIEEVPRYSEERAGYEKFISVLGRMKEDVYYPDIHDKATNTLIQINKGHLFSNGNKRLALVTTAVFYGINGYSFKELSKQEYKNILISLFPEHTDWVDFAEFTATDFATYHLSIIVAESGAYNVSHDDLKERVKRFFEATIDT